ncbi:hemerythrin domain-containing protein [Nocardioides rubriscoriae]|uniref:hemerythrin domain-containing protein n=1 Tax=Nocardioides rubriscoriae TaxID=642762 RepID=UPI001478A6D2|nr:hemerythrin domain-containing protein [Nocardioides rubriscoriae]
MEIDQPVLRPHPSTGVDVRDMVMAHRAFRREFRLAPAAVRRVAPGDRRQTRRVAAHLRGLVRALHHHHDGEDRLLWPRLHARVPAEVGRTVALVEAQHETIAALLGAAEAQLAGWVDGAGAEGGERLARTLGELSEALDEHLAAEEEHVLPLAAAHLTVAEWQELERDGLAAIPRSEGPVLVGMLMYEGDAEVLGDMVGRMPAVPRLVLPRVAPRAYARRARRIHGTATP